MKKLTKTLISLTFGVTLLLSGFAVGTSFTDSASGYSQQGGKVIYPPSEGTA